jgi:hypothetical protein
MKHLLSRSWAVGIVGLSALGCLIVVGPNLVVSAWTGYLEGAGLRIEPRVVELGASRVGQARPFRLRITNGTRMDVEIQGIGSCSCEHSDEFPFSLRPGESREITLIVGERAMGAWTQELLIFTSHGRDRVMKVILRSSDAETMRLTIGSARGVRVKNRG